MENQNKCCFTGHRTLEGDFNKDKLYLTLETLYTKRGIDTFICGGAVGFDMEVAFQVLSLKRKHENVKLWLFLPCLNQDARWSYQDKMYYKYLLEHADFVDCPNTPYTKDVMKIRNYKMVDNSGMCVCYFKGHMISGTAQTIRYARKRGVKIYNLASEGQAIIEKI